MAVIPDKKIAKMFFLTLLHKGKLSQKVKLDKEGNQVTCSLKQKPQLASNISHHDNRKSPCCGDTVVKKKGWGEARGGLLGPIALH